MPPMRPLGSLIRPDGVNAWPDGVFTPDPAAAAMSPPDSQAYLDLRRMRQAFSPAEIKSRRALVPLLERHSEAA